MAETKDFPTLYRRASGGELRVWSIRTVGSTIYTTHGVEHGKMQIDDDTITAGKNIGRSNETTPVEQAQLEAQSKWERKQKSGYHSDRNEALKGEVDREFVAGDVEPMLAHPFKKHGHKITWPAFVQPKLDGHRCIAIVNDDGSVSLWSRTRKPIVGAPHIAAELERLDMPIGTVLDGELYNHDYRDSFESLTSLIKTAPAEGEENTDLQYHVYDMVSSEPFSARHDHLEIWLSTGKLVRFVETVWAENEDAMREWFSLYLSEGYEGAMVRVADSPYVGKRSYHLQKVKEFDDAEYLVVDVVEGRGRMAGKAVFVCETPAGDTFRCKMAGDMSNLELVLKNKDDYIGRELTVQFQGKTSAAIPRFPVGLRMREDV